MQVVILNGTLSEDEEEVYIQWATKKYPIALIEKLFLDVHSEYVEISFILHKFRELRKMGGCCIGDPSNWNHAKQAELRDTIPNSV